MRQPRNNIIRSNRLR